eukprot:gene17058-18776_t
MEDGNEVKVTGCTQTRHYPWFICSLSFLVQFLAMSFYGSFGPLYVEMLRVFHDGDAATAWIPSISFSIAFVIAPVTYQMGDRIGFRTTTFIGSLLFGLGIFISSFATSIKLLYFTIGILVAVGYSLCQSTSMFILPSYFGTNWSLPLGIALSGSGFGALALSSLKAFLFDQFGYKLGMQVLSCTAIPIALAGMMFKKQNKKNCDAGCSAQDDDDDDDSLGVDEGYPPLHRNKAFFMLLVASFAFHSVYLITFVHLTRLAGDLGISDAKSALLPGILTLFESVGKIFMGKLIANFRGHTITFYQLSWAGMALAKLLCPLANGFSGLVVYSISWGFFAGAQAGACVPVIGHIVGNKNVVRGYSIFLMCFAPAILIGPPLAGYVRETTLNYAVAFYAAGGIVAVAASLQFLVKLLHAMDAKRRHRASSLTSEPQSTADDVEHDRKQKQPLQLHQVETIDSMNNTKPLQCRDGENDKYSIGEDTFFFHAEEEQELRDCFLDTKFAVTADDVSNYLGRETII